MVAYDAVAFFRSVLKQEHYLQKKKLLATKCAVQNDIVWHEVITHQKSSNKN